VKRPSPRKSIKKTLVEMCSKMCSKMETWVVKNFCSCTAKRGDRPKYSMFTYDTQGHDVHRITHLIIIYWKLFLLPFTIRDWYCVLYVLQFWFGEQIYVVLTLCCPMILPCVQVVIKTTFSQQGTHWLSTKSSDSLPYNRQCAVLWSFQVSR
jgi:hypothetical protein